MNQNNKKDNNTEWRRSKVQELASQGYNHSEISKILQISRPTITRDIQYLSECAKQNIKKYIDQKLPEEYEKYLVGITAILREAWNTSQQTEDNREKIQALSLAKDCYSMKLDLLTNATVVDDAVRFIISSSSSNQQQDKEKEKTKGSRHAILTQDSNTNRDIQGIKQEDKQQQQHAAATTTNKTF
jgi:predicted transcriptional regulator